MRGHRTLQVLAGAAAAAYALALAALLLWPNGSRIGRLNLDLYLFFLHRGVPASVQPEHYAAVLNVLVFVPVTLVPALWLGRGRWWQWAASGAVASVAAETAQALLLPGREPSVLDVVANSLGGLVGALLAAGARRRLGRGDRGLTREPDRPAR